MHAYDKYVPVGDIRVRDVRLQDRPGGGRQPSDPVSVQPRPTVESLEDER
jgi:hypothetical protein